MGAFARMTGIAVLIVVPWRLAGAEPDADPSGHWQGAVEVPGKPVTIEVDLAKNARGELIGTLDNPSDGTKGLPLAQVAVAGREVRFVVTSRSGGGSFRATLRGDGQAMAGELTLAHGGQQLAFQLARSGNARIAPPLRSPAITKQLAGSWTGTITAEGKHLTIGLTLANQPDGTATGTLTSDGLELPVAIAQTRAQVRIDVPSVSGTYVGELKPGGGQLVGTWRQRSQSLPLTFRRATP